MVHKNFAESQYGKPDHEIIGPPLGSVLIINLSYEKLLSLDISTDGVW